MSIGQKCTVCDALVVGFHDCWGELALRLRAGELRPEQLIALRDRTIAEQEEWRKRTKESIVQALDLIRDMLLGRVE